MKKLYFIAIIALTISTAANAQTTSSDPTFTITELQAPSTQEGIIYTGSKYDAQIEVKLRNVTPKTWSGIFSIYCIEEPNMFFDYPYIELVGTANGGNSSADHSFVEIHNLGEADIERVEFVMGAAATTAKLVCAPSIDGTNFFDADWELQNGSGVYKNISVEGMDDICQNAYSYDIPDYITNPWEGEEYTEFRKKAKYVRLNWGKSFAGSNTTDKGGSANIFALKVYTNADTTITGIEEKEQNKLNITLNGDKLTVSETADIQVHSVQGKSVLSLKNINEANLSGLAKGIYIIKAQSFDKKQTVVKKVIL